jgi:hypothetical protein
MMHHFVKIGPIPEKTTNILWMLAPEMVTDKGL